MLVSNINGNRQYSNNFINSSHHLANLSRSEDSLIVARREVPINPPRSERYASYSNKYELRNEERKSANVNQQSLRTPASQNPKLSKIPQNAQDLINQLEMRVYSDYYNKWKQSECVICCENIKKEKISIIPNWKHIFHTKCIQEYIKARLNIKVKFICPIDKLYPFI